MTSCWLNWSWCLLLTLSLAGWMDLQQYVGLFTSHTGNHRSQCGTAVPAAAVQPSPAHGASIVDICRPGLQAGCPRGDPFQAPPPAPGLWHLGTVLGLGRVTPSPLCGVFSLRVSVCVSESFLFIATTSLRVTRMQRWDAEGPVTACAAWESGGAWCWPWCKCQNFSSCIP